MSELIEKTEGQLLSEEYGMTASPAVSTSTQPADRTVAIVTLEIRILQRQAQQVVLGYAIEIGRRLEEVKAMLPHGQWGAYLKNEVNYSQSTANNFMRIFREYGADQQSLFGGVAKSQSFANLTYTKALRLLAIPDEEERERFIAEHDVEGMSNRELDEALKARDKAKDAKKKADEKRKAAEEALEAAQKELAELKAKGPEVRELTQEEKDALTADAVKKAKAEDAERILGMEKALAASDPNVAEFKVRFTSWQEEHRKMMEVLGRIAQSDKERATKFQQAVKTALEQMDEV